MRSDQPLFTICGSSFDFGSGLCHMSSLSSQWGFINPFKTIYGCSFDFGSTFNSGSTLGLGQILILGQF